MRFVPFSSFEDDSAYTHLTKVVEFNDAQLAKRQEEIAQEYQFVIQERNMTLYGTCADCQNKSKR